MANYTPLNLDSSENYKLKQDTQGFPPEAKIALHWQSDPSNPCNWSTRKKWLITLIPCYITLIVGINATSITGAAPQINTRFNISDASFPNSFWPVTAWNVGAALAPMLALPLMESHGMRPGYIASYVAFVIFVVPQAIAPNFATLLVCRYFAGCAGGVLQDAMDGIIADVWQTPVQRSLPVSVYVFSLLAGVSLGPVLGGAVVSRLDWRWIFYIQLILYGVSTPLVFMFKETRGPVILSQHAKKMQVQPTVNSNTTTTTTNNNTPQTSSPSTSTVTFLSTAIGRPTTLLTTDPTVFSFTLLSALSYGLVFLSTQSITEIYTTTYAWAPWSTNLLQTPLLLGELLGLLACLPQNALFARAAAKQSHDPPPETRLYLCILGAFLGLAAGLFLYAFTARPSLTWVLPALGLGLLGFGSVAVMQPIMIYITDAYAEYAGSASAAVCFGENIVAGFLPLAAPAMYSSLGHAWASGVLGFVAVGLGIAPVVLVWKGEKIRRRSRTMKGSEGMVVV